MDWNTFKRERAERLKREGVELREYKPVFPERFKFTNPSVAQRAWNYFLSDMVEKAALV